MAESVRDSRQNEKQSGYVFEDALNETSEKRIVQTDETLEKRIGQMNESSDEKKQIINELESQRPDSAIRHYFGVSDQDIRTYSPLTLAYIGDGIFDLVIRTLVVGKANTSPNKLHERTSRIVCAHAQAEMMKILLPVLTDEEQVIFRRGRNAKSYTMAKNASVADYRTATGFEALMGYLYMKDETKRMLELIEAGLKGIEAGLI